jgi:hypothetical protein
MLMSSNEVLGIKSWCYTCTLVGLVTQLDNFLTTRRSTGTYAATMGSSGLAVWTENDTCLLVMDYWFKVPCCQRTSQGSAQEAIVETVHI